MLNLLTKRDLVGRFRAEYSRADRAGKGRILDSLCEATGWNRKYAVQAMKSLAVKPGKQLRARHRIYGPHEEAILLKVWHLSGNLASKRLAPFMAELLEVLRYHGELKLPPATEARMAQMSASTIDRLLRRHKRTRPPGYFSTKPGSLIKQQVAVRLGSGWDETRPGFVEIDTVAHGADSMCGSFLWTLTLTDVATGWTELVALKDHGSQEVMRGLRVLQDRLPFKLLGVDSDNGREFIHWSLVRFCRARKIQFTRGRPYHKNDQCRVEQKNGAIVRRHVGYRRYDTAAQYHLLCRLYGLLKLLVNYFEPSLKGKDKAKTPYRRLLESGTLDESLANEMEELRISLNPVKLRKELYAIKMELLDLDSTTSFLHDASIDVGSGF